VHVENEKNQSDNRSNWKPSQIIHKIHKHTEKARNQESTDNSHIGHCKHTSERTKHSPREITLHVRHTVTTEQLQLPYNLDTSLVLDI
jgi:hypothetical protein